MTPDIHNLVDYPLTFVHDTMPGAPHPNALGHELMANAILPVIALPPPRP